MVRATVRRPVSRDRSRLPGLLLLLVAAVGIGFVLGLTQPRGPQSPNSVD